MSVKYDKILDAFRDDDSGAGGPAGNVVNPNGATQYSIAIFEDTTGHVISSSPLFIDPITGDLTVTGRIINPTGNIIELETTNLTVEDPLIKLASNNAADAFDIGFYGQHSTSTYTGLFRDATTGTYNLFKDLTVEPTDTVNIAGGGYALADLNINTLSGSITSGGDLNIYSTAHATKGSIFLDDINIKQVVLNNTSTGIHTGGTLAINGDTTKFDVAATTGIIVDSSTDPANPTLTPITYAGATAITVTNIATHEFTHIYLTSSSTILQSVVEPTPELRRDNIYIGKIIHTDNINVTVISNQPEVTLNPGNAIIDYWRALGLLVIEGNRISANGANLSIDRSAGDIFQSGANSSNLKNPNIKFLASDTLVSFRYRTQTSTETGDVTVLDPSNYDNAGTVTAIGGSNNQATNIRVYLFQTGNIRVQYGQQIYSTLNDAIIGLTSEPFIIEPNIKDNATLLGVISVTKGASDLSDTGDAHFSPASKFGEVGAGSGNSSVSTVQNVYDNSVSPQMILNETLGTFIIEDAATPITTNLFEVQSTGGASSYLSVSPTGVSIGNTTPVSKFHVFTDNSTLFTPSAVNNGVNAVASFENTNATVDTFAAIRLRSGSADGSIAYVNKGANSGDWVFSTDGGLSGVERLRITDGGSIGVGTDTPLALFHVDGNARFGNLQIEEADFGIAGSGKTIYADSVGTGVLGFTSTTAFDFNDGADSRLHIDVDGNVGIGSTLPTSRLSIYGEAVATNTTVFETFTSTGVPILSLFNANSDATPVPQLRGFNSYINLYNGITLRKNTPGGSILLCSSSINVTKLTVASTGEVAVGASTATAKLHVFGELDQIQSIIQAHSTQTNDLFQVKDSSGNIKVKIESDYTISVGTTNYETLVTDDNDIPNKKYVDDTTVSSKNYTPTTKTADFTVTESNNLILSDCTSNDVTISLPVAPTTGFSWDIKKTDKTAFDLIIDTVGSETIEGETSITITSTGSGEINTSLTIVFDGTNYQVI